MPIQEKLKEIISIIVNSEYNSGEQIMYVESDNRKLICGNNYYRICELLEISEDGDSMRIHTALVKLTKNYPGLFDLYGINAYSRLLYYNDKLIIFLPK
jgi:hypothetical protein